MTKQNVFLLIDFDVVDFECRLCESWIYRSAKITTHRDIHDDEEIGVERYGRRIDHGMDQVSVCVNLNRAWTPNRRIHLKIIRNTRNSCRSGIGIAAEFPG